VSFKKILVANRGEIAVRVIRACREMGIATVAVYSQADRGAPHVAMADEAVFIGPSPSRDSYLRIDRVLEAASATGAEAIHPGYGFLAENPAFARACMEAGVAFIGPRSETIALMGEKTSARRLAVEAGIPVVPGSLAPASAIDEIRAEAERLGFPVLLKAAAGGGGKGMRLVESQSVLEGALQRVRGEAKSAFGDDRVYVEKAIASPRHIEIQVLADHHGNAVHLFERECSVQRRHQKVIEESPSPFVTPELRSEMGALALALVRRAGYRNAGTLEFLVDQERRPYFLEMNTRLQVEHPVTEMVTGLDLVKLQVRIAAGERLPFAQEDLRQDGHAIECRVYAEDASRGFLPSPGRIVALRLPGGPGIRDDSGVHAGYDVPVDYDPLLSKVIAHAENREAAIARMRRAVAEYQVLGVATTLPFHARVLCHAAFVSGDYDTSIAERLAAETETPSEESLDVAIAAAAIAWLRSSRPTATERSAQPAPSGWWRAGLLEAQRGRG
jgi:acetyl-CoA carboxylase, biotin carboxylase subunit